MLVQVNARLLKNQIQSAQARVAELADAQDLKSCEGSPSCGFESHPGHFEDARPTGLSADGVFPAEASTCSKIPPNCARRCARGKLTPTHSNSLQPTQANLT